MAVSLAVIAVISSRWRIVDQLRRIAKPEYSVPDERRTLTTPLRFRIMLMKFLRSGSFMGLSLLATSNIYAETLDDCLLHAVQSASAATTVGELRTLCEQRLANVQSEPIAATEQAAAIASNADGVMEKRSALERYSHDNPFVLTPHRPNYLLPVVYSSHPNSSPFANTNADLQRTEVQFQLSLKVLVLENLLGDNGHLSFAYTDHSFWQAYNRNISAPFRESDHEPELIFTLENDWRILGLRNSANQFILNHQSNGRGGEFSRSWNRIMFNSIWEKDNVAFSLKPWYRVPEDKKRYPGDTRGDDNPDIESYFGNFELLSIYQAEHGQTVSLLLRNNLRDDNKGAAELSYSFPIGHTRLKGYLKYFNGYGESLIDYNHHTQSFGAGFLISDWL
jgi:phospholipase A1/A2